MRPLQLKDKWILVTGASSGLGREMARVLAREHRANLIITARRKDKLTELETELQQSGVKVKIIVADLSRIEEADSTIKQCVAEQELYGAILNAGITYFGRHTNLPWEQFQSILQTNVLGVVRMTNKLVEHFETTGKEGGIMVVSSMAAFYPVPYQAAYSGTKGFILNFITALSHEIRNRRLSLTVYAPAGIATEMTGGEKFTDLKGWLMPVSQAAKEGINAFRFRKYTHVPGFLNRAGAVLMKFLPAKFIAGRMGKVYLKALREPDLKS